MGKMHSAFLIFTTFIVAELLICCLGEEGNATSRCIFRERSALLRFKASLSDPSGRLSSWNAATDCCEWQGIMCDETSGHVIGLHLQNLRYYDRDYFPTSTYMLHAETLNSSLLDLKHLSFLDLSGNDFNLASIPSFFRFMNQLQHLNLSLSNFSGVVPHHIGNLSLLSVLDLSYNQLTVSDFTWVSHLSLLNHLNMSLVDLSPTNDLLKVLNILPFLIDLRMSKSGIENRNLQHACVNSTLKHIEYLDLSDNIFHGELPCFLENMTSLRDLRLSSNNYISCNKLPLVKSTNLVHLDLDYNSLECNVDSISEFILDKPHLEYLSLVDNSCYGDVSKILLNLSGYPIPKLEYLDLGFNNFYGQLPEEIGGIRKLQELYLNDNLIGGPVPTSIGNLSALKYLSLSSNNISYSIPSSIGNLQALESLSLGVNQLTGLIPSSLGNLSAFKSLGLSGNKLTGPIPSAIGNLRPLEYLSLRSNQLSGPIPSSLGNLTALRILDLSSNHISNSIPSSLGNLNSLELLSLRNNQLNREIPASFFDSLSKLQFLWIDTNSLKFVARSDWTPPFQLNWLSMGSCEIGGVFPQWIQTQKELQTLSLPNCSISGEIPESLCEMKSLSALILGGNSLLGSLPECVGNLNMLQVLALSSNRLSGVIPNSIGGAYSLKWLQLSNNRFSGELPYDLRKCTELTVLDIGENAISGKVPKWMGNYLLNLRVLQLRSNELYGTIPSNLCQLSELQVLDLGINNLTGNIPHCIHNFTRMVFKNSSIDSLGWYGLKLMIKGLELDYSVTLKYVVYMDLSSNNLVGEIPLDLTMLGALHFLNLSHNHLQGHIPRQVGDMNSLESLDLSNNNLSGNIPDSLSKLTSMSHLNLSHNKLTGEIPTGYQLRTLVDASIYEGNPGLCGAPLPKKCHEDKASPNLDNPDVEGEEDKTDRIWLYGIVISGFATGFWGAIGVLVFKIRWRHVYFKFTDEIIARIFGA